MKPRQFLLHCLTAGRNVKWLLALGRGEIAWMVVVRFIPLSQTGHDHDVVVFQIKFCVPHHWRSQGLAWFSCYRIFRSIILCFKNTFSFKGKETKHVVVLHVNVLLLNSAKFVFLKFVIILNMSLFPKIGFLRSSAKWRRKTCLKVVAAIEDATGKGLGGPRHFIGFVRTWHKRKQEVYIKGICIHVCCYRLILNLEKARTTCVFTNNKWNKMSIVSDSGSILCQILDRSSVSTLALWQVLPAHQLQQVSNGELWAN